MCDYSLQGIRNRLAKEGETLVVHRFQTGSKGLTAPEFVPRSAGSGNWFATLKRFLAIQTRECAVCIPDGARLRLTGIPPRLQRQYHVAAMESVTFRQLSADAATYRDAVEFANGAKVRLQELDEGQPVEVMALSSSEVAIPEETSFFFEESFSDISEDPIWVHRGTRA